MSEIHSLAIAGAWGYIGRKFLDAGIDLDLELSVLDPGPVPPDVCLDQLVHFTDDGFYQQNVDLFHLALHPEQRGPALRRLLERAQHGPVAILNEKPMAAPDRPQDCVALIDAVSDTQAVLLFDFPELFEPFTGRVVDYLRRFDHVEIEEIIIQRSKDREDPGNPRNHKRMVHIQYQESVHCIAWLLFVLGQLEGSVEKVLARGLHLSATARPYMAPNPQDYDHVVDGKVEYEMQLGATTVRGVTDFTRGAAWAKSRILRGRADGAPLELHMSYMEGAKHLRIDGQDQYINPQGSSYKGVLQTFGGWLRHTPPETLMSSSCYPNPKFARLTYALSSLLWRSCHDGAKLTIRDAKELVAFDAGFAEAASTFPRYG